MAKELLVNVSRGEEVRVALVEEGRLEEIYLERDSAASNVGNIYLGKVTNVEGSIQAAFIDFGYGRNGFLHVQDLHPDYFPEGGRWDNMTERVGKKIGRRDRPPIQDSLRRGDHIIVQIIKEGIGTKGPTLTSYPSIPGRFLVMMPGVRQMGVSKNIEDEDERRRLRKILDGLSPPKDVGFIIRTAGAGKAKTELERDFKYLSRLWEEIDRTKKGAKPPTLLYSEGDLVTRTVRDVWTSDIDRVLVDDVETALQIKQFFKLLMPRTKVDVQLYQGQVPLFHAAGVEEEIETMFSRHVPMASGASLVIDTTEAIVAIDVNSGKFRAHDDAEETAFQTDMEAAEEICRQLRLRDLGGLVIVDFIDLRYTRHRQALFDHLTELFKRDRAKSRHLEMNEFGIVSITRQRMRPDLKKAVFMDCPWSNGTGVIKTPESMALDVMRRLRVAAADERVERVVVGLYPSAALHVLNSKRKALAELERDTGTQIEIRQNETIAADAVVMELFDERDGQVVVQSLQERKESKPDSGGQRKRRRRGKDRDEGGAGDGSAAGATDREGMIVLPDLVELGDLSLEATEKLIGELLDSEAKKRSVSHRDPRAVVLDALQNRPFDDEAEEPTEESRAAQPQAASGDGRKKRRRRRRRGEPADAQHVAETHEAAPAADENFDEEPAHDEEVLSEVAGDDRQDGRKDRPEERAEGDGRHRGRRRRRRGRRDGSTGEQHHEAPPTPPEERDPHIDADRGGEHHDDEEEFEPEKENGFPGLSPDERLDASVNGNRIDQETHVLRRDPFLRPRTDDDESSSGEPRRRRRRRRGGGQGGQPARPAQPAPAGRDKPAPADDRQDDPNRQPAPAPAAKRPDDRNRQRDQQPAPARPQVEQKPTSPAEQERAEVDGEPRRRRRRRRGRGGARPEQHPAELPASSDAAQPDPEEMEGIEVEPVEVEQAEPELTQANPVEEAPAPEAEAPPRRSRRRRRGRGSSAARPVEPESLVEEASEPADDSAEAEAEPVDEAPGTAEEPAAGVEPEPAPKRKAPVKKATRKTAGATAKKTVKKAPKKTAKKTVRKRAKKAEAAEVD